MNDIFSVCSTVIALSDQTKLSSRLCSTKHLLFFSSEVCPFFVLQMTYEQSYTESLKDTNVKINELLNYYIQGLEEEKEELKEFRKRTEGFGVRAADLSRKRYKEREKEIQVYFLSYSTPN
jgi:hypothetical protein